MVKLLNPATVASIRRGEVQHGCDNQGRPFKSVPQQVDAPTNQSHCRACGGRVDKGTPLWRIEVFSYHKQVRPMKLYVHRYDCAAPQFVRTVSMGGSAPGTCLIVSSKESKALEVQYETQAELVVSVTGDLFVGYRLLNPPEDVK